MKHRTRNYRHILPTHFRRSRNLRRVSAQVGSVNEASIELLESLGFEHEGTLREATWFQGEYHDMLWYGLLREN
ncbi:GNAT family N-acetyltransferase [Haladaptatus pallidirubidus]|uniref:GNAT family N-acetyltransferase n=1 Tax=Haladaptatus pallidirubidus TaxID=1008152 RepID=UPI00223925E3|nr:GNAT family protein [Haladaptatus pallidirubidus]